MCISDASKFTDRNKIDVVNLGLRLSGTPIFFDQSQIWKILKSQQIHISANTVFYRRSAYFATGKHQAQLEEYADWYLNLKLATKYGSGYLPFQFCLHAHS